jgi:hypothetical protein
LADAAGQKSAAGGGRSPGLNLDRGRRRDQVREIRACNEVLSHIPNRSSPVGARTGAPRNEGYLPPAGERGNERHRLGRSHLCDSSGFRSLASIAGCRLPGLGSPSSVSLHGRISFGSPLVRQTFHCPEGPGLGSAATCGFLQSRTSRSMVLLRCLAIADSRRVARHLRASPSRIPQDRGRASGRRSGHSGEAVCAQPVPSARALRRSSRGRSLERSPPRGRGCRVPAPAGRSFEDGPARSTFFISGAETAKRV